MTMVLFTHRAMKRGTTRHSGSRTLRLALAECCFLLSLLAVSVHTLDAQDQKKYWVYFTDKGNGIPASGTLSKEGAGFQQAIQLLSPHTLQRRAKVLPPESVVDAGDIPLFEPYLQQVGQAGGVLCQQSRWLNAASFSMTPAQAQTVGAFSFVKSVTPVRIALVKNPQYEKITGSPYFSTSTALDYGASFTQVSLVDAIALHQIGITGNNVIVGMLDSGFRWRGHEALKTRNVIAEYDFVFHDSVTSNQANDSQNQDEHGTFTLSILGGYKEGQLIGPAFDAEFILAKTEYVPSETEIEEDNWAAGIEWEESLGADVVSSSLGYNTFDDGGGYTWANGDFNGRTSVTAQAAVRAARLGVVVCNSMGNEGNGDGVEGTMLTPADADSILSVGAISLRKQLAGYSSTGPTNDGRIKPDIVAPGSGIYCAYPGVNTYGSQTGTSMSAPLVAASAALVLSARPELTPMQVINALRNTATRSGLYPNYSFPNNFLGWGLADAFNAALSFGPVFSNQPVITSFGAASIVSTMVASKFGVKQDSVLLYYKVENAPVFRHIAMQLDSSMYYPTSGRYTALLPGVSSSEHVQFYIEARDSAANSYRSPSAFLHTTWQFCCGIEGVWSDSTTPKQSTLLQNYPNPFNSTTTIMFQLKEYDHTEVSVYSVTGQKIKTLFDDLARSHVMQLRWDGTNEQGLQVASGVYIIQLVTPTFTSSKTMMLLR